MFVFFLKGLGIGFAVAAPVGPIGVLCIQRTLARGRLIGFVSGLGAAVADGVYGLIAASGLTVISGFLIDQQDWLALGGGLFLCYLAVRTFFRAGQTDGARVDGGSGWTAFLSTFLLTLTNPTTILSFIAIFAGLGLAASRGSVGEASLLVLGVFLGSAAWWLLLAGGTGLMRERMLRGSGLTWVNRIAGLIIGGFGIAALTGSLG